MANDFSLLDILKTLSKWKKKIIYTCLGIAVLSAIISLILPVYYSSSTTFYAANPDLASPAPLGYTEVERPIYGTDLDLDRLFSIAKSNELYDYLISKYDLLNHYEIDPNNEKASYFVREHLTDNYKTLKTKYGALQLTVMDTDPTQSAAMANDARTKISEIALSVIKDSQKELLGSLDKSISNQETQGKAVSDSIRSNKERYQIVNSESQGEVYAELITKARSKALTAKAKAAYFKETKSRRDSIRKYTRIYESQQKILTSLEGSLGSYNQGLTSVQKYELEYERLIDQISLDKEKRKQLQSVLTTPFSAVHIVESAKVPVIKAKPKRSLIVIGATLIGFVFCCLGVLFIESNKNVDWKSIWNAENA